MCVCVCVCAYCKYIPKCGCDTCSVTLSVGCKLGLGTEFLLFSSQTFKPETDRKLEKNAKFIAS